MRETDGSASRCRESIAMPQRTNPFQELVARFIRVIQPYNARVVESKMAELPAIGEICEIDVVTDAEFERHTMRIAIEAKDRKHKLSRDQMDEICGKFLTAGSPVVDKVIVVSRKGFSKAAQKKAEINGIELWTLDEFENADWKQFFPPCIQRLPNTLKFANLPPQFSNVRMTFLGELPEGTVLDRSRIMCKCHNTDFGNIEDFVLKLAREKHNDWIMDPGEEPERSIHHPLPGFYLLTSTGAKIDIGCLSFDIRSLNVTMSMNYSTFLVQGKAGDSQVFHDGVGTAGERKIKQTIGPEAKVITMNLNELINP